MSQTTNGSGCLNGTGTVYLSSTTGIRAGMIVSGSANIPTGTAVTNVTSTAVGINTTCTSSVSSGVSLTFTGTPLKDAQSLAYSWPVAANISGNGVAFPFTIDVSDKSEPIKIDFDYTLNGTNSGFGSGSYASGAITDSEHEIWIYDITNGAMIQPSGYILTCGSTIGTLCSASATFQSASNSTSYRVLLHSTATSSSGSGLYNQFLIDNFRVARVVTVYGMAGNDWVNAGAMQVTASSAYTFTIPSSSITLGWQYTNNGNTYTATETTSSSTSITMGGTGSPSTPSGTLACITSSGCSTSITYSVAPTLSVPVIGSGSINNVWWRRVGGNAEIRFEFKQTAAGTSGTGQYMFYMPSTFPFQIDTSKLTSQNVALGSGNFLSYPVNTLGSFVMQFSTSNSTLSGSVYAFTGNYFLFAGTAGSSASATPSTVSSGYPGFGSQPMSLSASFSVPIVGWSSTVQMSDQADGREVALIANKSAGSVTANTTIPTWTNTVKDTHAAFNASTGVYTVPIAGDYLVNFTAYSTSASMTALIYKNGSVYAQGVRGNSTLSGSASAIVSCVAGDTISVAIDASLTITTSTTQTVLSINRISGIAAIGTSESVNARYYASSTSITSSLATIVWSTKDYDTHSGMASGVYTVPVSGKYQINASVNINDTTTPTTTTVYDMQLQKNGTNVSEFYSGSMPAQGGQRPMNLSDIIYCNAGDLIRVQVSVNGGTPQITSNNTQTFFSLSRVGN